MSIFDPEPVPSRLIGVLRTLHQAEGRALPLKQLQELMHPESVWGVEDDEEGKPNTMVERSLKLCVDLQLVDPPGQKDGPYRLRKSADLGDLGAEDCIRELGRRLLDGRRVPDSDRSDLYQLSWILAWYLEQPPARWPSNADGLRDCVGPWEKRGFKKINQRPHFGQLLHWGRALGLLSLLKLRGPGEKSETSILVVNPGPFLRRHLPDFMKVGERLDVDAWFKELAERFGIFETGTVRRQVIERDDRVISPALELALRQLADEEVLRLEGVTDGKEYWLQLEGPKPLSHLTYLPRKGA